MDKEDKDNCDCDFYQQTPFYHNGFEHNHNHHTSNNDGNWYYQQNPPHTSPPPTTTPPPTIVPPTTAPIELSTTYVAPPPDGSRIYDIEYETSSKIVELDSFMTGKKNQLHVKLFSDSYTAPMKKTHKIRSDYEENDK